MDEQVVLIQQKSFTQKIYQMIARANLKKVKIKEKKNLVCSYLSNLEGKKALFIKIIVQDEQKVKKLRASIFPMENGVKCDTVRQKVENWKRAGLISDDEYFYEEKKQN